VDLHFSKEDEDFRSELRGWLDANLPAEMRAARWWRDKSGSEQFEIRREWEAGKAEAGFAGIHWPTEYGGRGGTPTMKAIYDEEMARANAPGTVNPLGLWFLAPTVMAVGTEQQKRDIIKPLLHAETIWCQGFSEPGAGSDLAALQLKAERRGDTYLLNGQKIWTSNAMYGDKIFTLARTSPAEASRHAGISMLLVDMHQPGVEVRPLKKLTGEGKFGENDFGEVFYTDAACPVSDVLGGEGNGWATAMLLLSFERGSSAIGQYTEFRQQWDEVVRLARKVKRGDRSASEDPVLRQLLADSLIDLECLKFHSWHVLTQTSQGKDLAFESSLTKMMWSETFRKVSDTYEAVLGTSFQVADLPDDTPLEELTTMALRSRSTTIWGGTAQVQRSVVAERLLGLPR
jgi:alkylation response protein AidB-like acyl-CoA dehydrogenase